VRGMVTITERAQASDGREKSATVLAHVLTGLLISDIAIAAAALIVSYDGRSDSPFRLQIALKSIAVLWRVASAVTVVVFLFWFYAARVRAERSDWPQRHARGWAFWGWIIPIADLWLPFQIMRDIWWASLPPSLRSKAAWLPAVWWVSWLLEGLLSRSWSARSSNFGHGLPLPASWTTFVPLAIAGTSLVVIIQVAARQIHDSRQLAVPLACL
jgi:hypothetical protein